MKIEFNCTGADRKKLVNAIATITGENAKYLGAPTFAYQVGAYHIDKNSMVTVAEGTPSDDVDRLVERLSDEGYVVECSGSEEPVGVCISMPASRFSDEALINLRGIIASKRALICKALGVAELPIEVTDTKVSFPWFPGTPTPEELEAYSRFISRLCEMACNQKRVVTTEKPIDNEKYAFRCFLLRLGFIGAEFKEDRKILLRNLSGSSAFKSSPSKADATRPLPPGPFVEITEGMNADLAETLADKALIQQVNDQFEVMG